MFNAALIVSYSHLLSLLKLIVLANSSGSVNLHSIITSLLNTLVTLNPQSVQRDFWAESAEILVFPSPSGYMYTLSGLSPLI